MASWKQGALHQQHSYVPSNDVTNSHRLDMKYDSFLPCLVVFGGIPSYIGFFLTCLTLFSRSGCQCYQQTILRGIYMRNPLIYLMQVPFLFLFRKVFQSCHFQAPCFAACHKLQARCVCHTNSTGVNPHLTKRVD